MKTARLFALALCTTLAVSAARATTVIPPTFDELVSQAQVIIQGTVTNLQSEWTGEGANRHIITYVTVKVEDTLKGEAGATYTMRLLGGTVGEDTMDVSDAPKFAVGNREILFIENNGTQFIPLVGIMHGRFHVEQDAQTGTEVVKTDNGKPLTDLAQLGHPEAAGKNAATQSSQTPLDVATFKVAIRSKLTSAQK